MEAVAAGKFQGLEKLVTKKIDLKDLVEDGIKALITEKDKQSKFMLMNVDILCPEPLVVKILVSPRG